MEDLKKTKNKNEASSNNNSSINSKEKIISYIDVQYLSSNNIYRVNDSVNIGSIKKVLGKKK